MNSQSLENPFASAFRASAIIFLCILGLCLSSVVSPLILLAPVAAAGFLWAIFRHPIVVLGFLLAFMPMDYMAIELGKFAGLPHMTIVSACTKEIPLLLLTLVLYRRNGFTPAAPDWFFLVCFALAAMHTVFDGSLTGLALDFNFILPYVLGRVTVLTNKQEGQWAKRAVWLVGILSVLGLSEVFIFGEGPRTLLYLATGGETDAGQLTSSFHATGLQTLREAATMVGPNGFGALCMIALILWWVYCRNPLPAGMITVGLICSVTRSAWLGAATAIPIVAIAMGKKKKFFIYAILAGGLIAASIPIIGLSDYIYLNKTGQDLSAQGHRDEFVNGLNYVADHPFGSGNLKLSVLDREENSNATSFETTYVNFAAEYGVPALFCLVGGLLSAIYLAWKKHSQLGYAAFGILVGMCTVMVVTIPLLDRRLACWAMFPVGLAVRSFPREEGVEVSNLHETSPA